MTNRPRPPVLTANAVASAKPGAKEYTLWDGTLAHFGLRVHPSGVKSFIVQTRARGRMRKITLGRFPELGVKTARRDAARVLARLWSGEEVAPPRKSVSPLFRDFAARYRDRSRYRWKPSSLKTFDTYMRARLMPHFGRLRLDAIDHARVSAWFDAVSAHRPGAANRAFEILRAMLASARQWGELGDHVPDACANIVRNPRRPVARYLDRAELERLGAVLDRRREQRPWPVAAIRLLTLTGARLSEILNLRWDQIGELGEQGASARIGDSKTGPRTIWLGPQAAKLLSELPRTPDGERVFPEKLTSARLYNFWVGVRDEAGLPGVRIHDCRHTWASQGVMNGVGLTTVGRLLGHRKRETTAIYAHLDDGALQDAAAQAAAIIARAMGYRAETRSAPDEPSRSDALRDGPESLTTVERAAPDANRTPRQVIASRSGRSGGSQSEGGTPATTSPPDIDWLGEGSADPDCPSALDADDRPLPSYDWL